MGSQEFVPSEEEINDYLDSLVDRGVLEMGIEPETGQAVFWATDDGARLFAIADALKALLFGEEADPTEQQDRPPSDFPHEEPLQAA